MTFQNSANNRLENLVAEAITVNASDPLDTIEKVSFNPQVTFNGTIDPNVSYSIQNGVYVHIGKLCVFAMEVEFDISSSVVSSASEFGLYLPVLFEGGTGRRRAINSVYDGHTWGGGSGFAWISCQIGESDSQDHTKSWIINTQGIENAVIKKSNLRQTGDNYVVQSGNYITV